MDGQTRGLLVVYSEIGDDLDEAFNDWYDNVHIPDVLALPHWLGCRRFELAGETVVAGGNHLEDSLEAPPHRYLAVWELDTVDVDAARRQLPDDLREALANGRLDMAERMTSRRSTAYAETSTADPPRRQPMRVAAPPEPVDEESAALLDEYEDDQGFVPNSMRVLGRQPGVLHAVRGLSRRVLDPVHLDRALALLAAHTCCRSVGDLYSAAHSAGALVTLHGERPERLRALATPGDAESRALFDDTELAVIDLARAAAAVPSRVADHHVEALRNHLSEDEILELLVAISYFGFLNRFNPMLSTELEPEARQTLTDILHVDVRAVQP